MIAAGVRRGGAIALRIAAAGALCAWGAHALAAGQGADRPKAKAGARCDKTYAREFTLTRATGRVRLRLVKPTPAATAKEPPTGEAAFEGTFQLCRSLGPGWQVAPGSFGASFLGEVKRAGSPELKAALAACPVTFRRVDRICAACVAGSRTCPCADRDISDWIFCEHA